MKNKFTLFVIVISAAIFGVSCTTTDGSASNENSTKLKHDFTEGLIAYYPFNGNPMDGTGNENHGELKGAALVKDRHGQAAKAYEFDGRSYIQFETSEELQTSKSTISYWLNATGTSEFECLPGFPGYQSFISKGKLAYGIAGKTVRDWQNFETPFQPRLKGWIMVTLTYDGKEQSVIINGGEEKYNRVIDATVGFLPGISVKRAIGRRDILRADFERANPGGYPFTGKIDDLRFYNRALSGTEIKALYDLEKPKK